MSARAVVVSIGLAGCVGLGMWFAFASRPVRDTVAPPAPPAPPGATPPAPVEIERAEPGGNAERSALGPGASSKNGSRSATGAPPALETVARTLLTENPDLVGFWKSVGGLADGASVVAGSVKTAENGAVEGDLAFRGTQARARFTLVGNHFRVAFDPPPDFQSGSTRSLSFALQIVDGKASRASGMVEVHPDNAHPSGAAPPMGEKRFAGWIMTVDAEALHAHPLAIVGGPDGTWNIGKSEGVASREEKGAVDFAQLEGWMRVLAEIPK